MRYLLMLLSFMPASLCAAPIEALAPMAFLAGHCWKGTIPRTDVTAEHCFTWMYDGKALRDVDNVHKPGAPDYAGETTYYFDAEKRQVEYIYLENQGGVGRGTMEPAAGALVFPATTLVEPGAVTTYRARWTRIGDNAYEALTEIQGKSGWTTMMKLTYERQPDR
jgi:hypothetical protein